MRFLACILYLNTEFSCPDCRDLAGCGRCFKQPRTGYRSRAPVRFAVRYRNATPTVQFWLPKLKNGCYDLVVVNFDSAPGRCSGYAGSVQGVLQNSTGAKNGRLLLLTISIKEIMTWASAKT
jgi:hypothetical protein